MAAAAAAAAQAVGYGITAVTLSQTLSGGGKDTEKAGPERPIQRWGRKQERQEAGGLGCRREESARGDERRASRGWDWLGNSTLLRRTLQRGGGCFPQGPEDWRNCQD